MADRFKRLAAPVSAVVFIALFVVVLAYGSSPDSSASGAKVIRWYHSHHTSATVSSFLLAYAALAGIVFFASVAIYLRDRGSQLLATTTLAGGIVFTGGLLVAAGLNAAIVDRINHINTTTAQTLN